MWVIVEFLKISDTENEVAEIYGPFKKESKAIDRCKKWNDFSKLTESRIHHEVYELNDYEE